MHRVALNCSPDSELDDYFERDCGLMDGDDGGYADFEQLCYEEDVARNRPMGVYHIYGQPSSSRAPIAPTAPFTPSSNAQANAQAATPTDIIQRLTSATTGILAASSHPNGVMHHGSSQQRYVASSANHGGGASINHQGPPLFSSDTDAQPNILQLLGPNNIVARNVSVLQNVRTLRQQLLNTISENVDTVAPTRPLRPNAKQPAQQIQQPIDTNGNVVALEPRSPKGMDATDLVSALVRPPVSSSIRDDALSDSGVLHISSRVNMLQFIPKQVALSRNRAIERAILVLMLAHGGFTDASQVALDILLDVFRHFLQSMGKSLNVRDEDGLTGGITTEEQLNIVGKSGFRGNMSSLVFYTRQELPRTEKAVLSAQGRLSAQVETLQRASRSRASVTDRQDAQEVSALTVGQGTGPSDGRNDLFPVLEPLSTPTNENRTQDKVMVQAQEEEMNVEDDAFAFGYINDNVRLDVLGDINVPKALAFRPT